MTDTHELIPVRGSDRPALVDADLAPLVRLRKWGAGVGGYVRSRPPAVADGIGAYQLLHRFVMQAPPHMDVDHINGDTLDNRRANLRLCTQSQNNGNMRLKRSNKSGYKGVRWIPRKRRWRAEIKINYRVIYLGQFRNIDDAARAYDTAARTHYGQFARLNFPEGPSERGIRDCA